MKKFEFRMDSALRWRNTQLKLERAKLQTLLAEQQRLNRDIDNPETGTDSGRTGGSRVKGTPSFRTAIARQLFGRGGVPDESITGTTRQAERPD